MPRAVDCPLCGDAPTITELVDYEWFCGVTADGRPLEAPPDGALPREIDARELARRLDGDQPPLIIDVRERWEWDAGNLEDRGARHLPLAALGDAPGLLSPDRSLVLVCSVGARSAGAAAHLRAAGFADVTHLGGGLRSWVHDVDPSLTVL